MLSITGAVLIFAASFAGGLTAAELYRMRVLQLEAFYMLVTHIGRQIDSFLSPLDLIYAEYREPILDKCGFLKVLCTKGGETALGVCRHRLFLRDAERALLEAFFSGLGKHPAMEEGRHCVYYAERIGELAKGARGELAKKTRLCRAFGMLFGIMLAVILL